MSDLPNDNPDGALTAIPSGTDATDLIGWLTPNGVNGGTLLIPEETVEDITGTFPINSFFLELTSAEQTEAYSTQTPPSTCHLLRDGELSVHSSFGNVEKNITVEDADSAYRSEFKRLQEQAEHIEIDVPPWDQLLSELESQVNRSTREEFETLVRAAQISDLKSLDEVSVALIAAAQSESLLYDISRWGEDVGLASKATFSRRKSALEEDGMIYTEKSPVDVGRPRLRLLLSDSVEPATLDIADGELTSDSSEEASEDEDESVVETASDPLSKRKSNDEEGEILAQIEQELEDIISSE